MIGVRVQLASSALLVNRRKQLRNTFGRAGTEIAQVARALIRRGTAGGRQYAAPGHGRYQASAPGSAPAVRTGKLLAGIRVSRFRSGLGVAVKDSEFYAKFMETGAKGGGRSGGKPARNRRGAPQTARTMLPRPFISAALEQRRASIEQRIRRAVAEDIRFERIKA